jgi:hypothetical protein
MAQLVLNKAPLIKGLVNFLMFILVGLKKQGVKDDLEILISRYYRAKNRLYGKQLVLICSNTVKC